ncbi:RecA-superfamily ATPase possibly involved in signal transduction [Aciduliprofundum sp. MAR08-339]|uniref:RAD55 family ATPase n=1 Tax=Aciduliprofundum sp. (strain MAR08-339) TaxID=673860 RepID=UPI0002A4802D|nr:RecA-superfamily ATPase possibly involved in signal transduction [Aciduliprofundum sp. MAR08-339]
MAISRTPSGINGLDPLIEGGFPTPSVILVAGSAGSGKTTFAFQFLVEGAKRGERGLYISTLSEKTEWMLRFISPYEFFDPKYIEDETIIYEDIGKELGTMDTMKLIIKINEIIAKYVPQRIVIDPINVVGNFVENYREFLFELVTLLKNWSGVTLLTGEVKPMEKYPEDVGYTADGIISLIMRTEDNVIKRYIQILKMRGTNHSMSIHPLEITNKGISVLKAQF